MRYCSNSLSAKALAMAAVTLPLIRMMGVYLFVLHSTIREMSILDRLLTCKMARNFMPEFCIATKKLDKIRFEI